MVNKEKSLEEYNVALILNGLVQCALISEETTGNIADIYLKISRKVLTEDTPQNRETLFNFLSQSHVYRHGSTPQEQFDYYQTLAEMTKVDVTDLMPCAEKQHFRQFDSKPSLLPLHEMIETSKTNKTPRKDLLVSHIISALCEDENDHEMAYLLALAKIVRRADLLKGLESQGADIKDLPESFSTRYHKYMDQNTIFLRQRQEETEYGVDMDKSVAQSHKQPECVIL